MGGRDGEPDKDKSDGCPGSDPAPDQRVHHADLQRGRAPADRQVGRDLGEAQPGAARAIAAPGLDSIWLLEHDRRRGRVLAQHLAQEPTLASGEVDRQAEGLSKRPAVEGAARPIHEGRAAPVTSWWCSSMRAGSAPASSKASRQATLSLPPDRATRMRS